LDKLATQRKALFDSRSALSQKARDFKGEIRQTPEPDASLPSEKIDVSALVAEKSRLSGIVTANAERRRDLEFLDRAFVHADEAVTSREREVVNLKRLLAEADQSLRSLIQVRLERNARYEALKTEVNILVDPSTSDIDAQIAAASDTNTKIDRAAEYRDRAKGLVKMESDVEALSEQIESLDEKKGLALERAVFPIPDLSFADGDISYNGTLFDQLSSAEQVRISLAMAMAMNPQLRVILIKDGSLLDEISMGIIREMAQTRDYQVWVEVVGNRQDATLIIEDGAVVGAEEVEPETEVVS
jgi:hypothetical protein